MKKTTFSAWKECLLAGVLKQNKSIYRQNESVDWLNLALIKWPLYLGDI